MYNCCSRLSIICYFFLNKQDWKKFHFEKSRAVNRQQINFHPHFHLQILVKLTGKYHIKPSHLVTSFQRVQEKCQRNPNAEQTPFLSLSIALLCLSAKIQFVSCTVMLWHICPWYESNLSKNQGLESKMAPSSPAESTGESKKPKGKSRAKHICKSLRTTFWRDYWLLFFSDPI